MEGWVIVIYGYMGRKVCWRIGTARYPLEGIFQDRNSFTLIYDNLSAFFPS